MQIETFIVMEGITIKAYRYGVEKPMPLRMPSVAAPQPNRVNGPRNKPRGASNAKKMDEHKRREMDKMNDMFGMRYSISVENQPYPVLCTLSADGCTAHVPDFPKVTAQAPTLDAALLEVKQQIQKALRQYKNPPIPTKQDQIVVPNNSVLVLVKAS